MPIIVGRLTRIGVADAAALAAEAISELKLAAVTPEPVRNAAEQGIVHNDEPLLDALERCDHQYYRITRLDGRLFAFVQSHAAAIQIPRPFPFFTICSHLEPSQNTTVLRLQL